MGDEMKGSKEQQQKRILNAAHDIIQHYEDIETMVMAFTFRGGEAALTMNLGKIEDCAMLLCIIAHGMMPAAVDLVIDTDSHDN